MGSTAVLSSKRFFFMKNQWVTLRDLSWMTTLFATAVGAGILFLPINAGLYGIWPFLFIAVFTPAMVYLSHRALTFVILHNADKTHCLNDVIQQNFSRLFSKLFGALYFLSTFPLLLIYGLGLTNTFSSILKLYFHLTLPRMALSLVTVGTLFLVVGLLESKIKTLIQYLAIPLSFILFGLSIYLIPHWNLSAFQTVPKFSDFVRIMWLTLPVIVFTFNFTPAISHFAHEYKALHSLEDSVMKTNFILKAATGLLFFFVMFFVCSCILSLHPSDMLRAKSENVSVLSYMALVYRDPFLTLINSMIAIVAMLGAFFGTYFGCHEATREMIKENFGALNSSIDNHSNQKFNLMITIGLFISTVVVAVLDTNIVDFISIFCGPVIAIIMFIFPMYAVYKINHFEKLRKALLTNGFLIVIGLVTLSAVFYSLRAIF